MRERRFIKVALVVLIILLAIDIGSRFFVSSKEVVAAEKVQYKVIDLSRFAEANKYEYLLNDMSNRGWTFDHVVMGAMGGVVVFRGNVDDDSYRLNETKAYMRALGTALGSYQVDHNAFPVQSSETDWNKNILPPEYYQGATQDNWGTPFKYWSDGKSYRLTSYGKDKAKGGSGLDADIVFSNGEFSTP